MQQSSRQHNKIVSIIEVVIIKLVTRGGALAMNS